MADGKQIGKVQRDQQLTATQEEAHAAQIEGRLKDLHTCLPGIIASFDPDTQTASVQPAIKRIFTEKGAVNLPLCVDVPVQFPGGGDFFLTFPVKPGDECMLHFSERCIDFWHANGGVQLPGEYRLHDLSDAMATVGINSQPRKIPAFNAADTELRSRAGDIRITVKPSGTIESVNPAGSHVLGADGSMTINAPAGTTINSPQIVLNGNVTYIGNMTGQAGNGGTGNASTPGTITAQTDVIGGGKSLKTHVHSGVQPGGGNTGQPV